MPIDGIGESAFVQLLEAFKQCESFSRFVPSDAGAREFLQRAKQVPTLTISKLDPIRSQRVQLKIRQAAAGGDCVVALDRAEPVHSATGKHFPPLLMVVDRIVSMMLPCEADEEQDEERIFICGPLLFCLNPLASGFEPEMDSLDSTASALRLHQKMLKRCLPRTLKSKIQLWKPCADPAAYQVVDLGCVKAVDPCFPVMSSAVGVRQAGTAAMKRQLLLDSVRVRLPIISPAAWLQSQPQFRQLEVQEGELPFMTELYD